MLSLSKCRGWIARRWFCKTRSVSQDEAEWGVPRDHGRASGRVIVPDQTIHDTSEENARMSVTSSLPKAPSILSSSFSGTTARDSQPSVYHIPPLEETTSKDYDEALEPTLDRDGMISMFIDPNDAIEALSAQAVRANPPRSSRRQATRSERDGVNKRYSQKARRDGVYRSSNRIRASFVHLLAKHSDFAFEDSYHKSLSFLSFLAFENQVVHGIASGMIRAALSSHDNLPRTRDCLSESATLIAIRCGWTSVTSSILESTAELINVVQPLGHGSMGVVEEVCILPSRSFVRKRVTVPSYRARQYHKILRSEVRALNSLAYPHIVKVIGFYENTSSAGKCFYNILMSPVGDRDLGDFLARSGHVGHRTSSISPDAASSETITAFFSQDVLYLATWFSCLASALTYMHAQGIRHQDIKPSNIVHRGPHVFFTDFSSAAQFDLGRTTSTENPARCSPMYSPPESVERPAPDYTPQRHGLSSDVFSLGCVFVEMLTVMGCQQVSDLWEFCRGEHGTKTPSRKGPALMYSQVTHRVEEWFAILGNQQITETYQSHVAPMLRRKREERPTAKGVWENLRELPPCGLAKMACPCEDDVKT